jgi:5-hydroxyisourate hydrolase
MGLSTHVLDLATGRPAAGLAVRLEREADGGWRHEGEGATDSDGRLRTLIAEGALAAATYRITFATGAWMAAQGRECFYPEVAVVFTVADPAQHHHVPLLLSPFGYSTYRGS